ncbi:addiction module antidote protein [Succinatimonas hippei]|uniref:addiction module antidote protein n=1 Tax=Succinatimonas hippei TaxID=626938 RepID=UPI0025FD4F5A|nr:addiction module antidote protein [Succinatimonas hippei]
MTIHLTKFDIQNHLHSEEDCRLALQAAYEEDPGDGSLICATLGDIAKYRGMSSLAKQAGLSRENLYRALSGSGNPEFATILKVIKALNLNPVFSATP